MNKKNVSMKVVNQDAAGIDVGSRSHFVATGQEPSDIYEFGVYNEDLKNNLAALLHSKGI
jgi:transposase